MPYNNNSFHNLSNPVTESLFVLDDDTVQATPGISRIITTEDDVFLTTENGDLLVTEG